MPMYNWTIIVLMIIGGLSVSCASVRLGFQLFAQYKGTGVQAISAAQDFDHLRHITICSGWIAAISIFSLLVPASFAIQSGLGFAYFPPFYWVGWMIGKVVYLYGRWTWHCGTHPFQQHLAAGCI